MKPVVDRLEKAYKGRVEFKVFNTSVPDPSMERLAAKFGVQYVPTFVLVSSKGETKGTVVGETSEESLAGRIEALK